MRAPGPGGHEGRARRGIPQVENQGLTGRSLSEAEHERTRRSFTTTDWIATITTLGSDGITVPPAEFG